MNVEGQRQGSQKEEEEEEEEGKCGLVYFFVTYENMFRVG